MTPLRIAVASLAVLMLAGCASMDERSSSRVAPQRTGTVIDTDADYVARVEAVARRRGIEVVWVNTPKKRIQRGE